jgi:tetratricopeptide (TPR) repeat protein
MLRDTLKPGMTKSEIEQFLQGKGDYVQIDHLGRFLKEPMALETKKFVFLKLAGLYEKAKMFDEAAKMYDNAAGLSIAFVEKIKHYMKETEFYAKLGAFDRVEQAMKKAMTQANFREQEEIRISVKMFYKEQAKVCEAELRRNQATRFYEKILEMRISEQERAEIGGKLLELYKSLGKIHEYRALEKSIQKP